LGLKPFFAYPVKGSGLMKFCGEERMLKDMLAEILKSTQKTATDKHRLKP